MIVIVVNNNNNSINNKNDNDMKIFLCCDLKLDHLVLNSQINISMYQFDAELLLLRHQKLHLDWELKMADLRRLTLCQELLLLMEFAKREVGLQEALDKFVREENGITVCICLVLFPCFTSSHINMDVMRQTFMKTFLS